MELSKVPVERQSPDRTMEERDIARCKNSGRLPTSSSRPQANLEFGDHWKCPVSQSGISGILKVEARASQACKS